MGFSGTSSSGFSGSSTGTFGGGGNRGGTSTGVGASYRFSMSQSNPFGTYYYNPFASQMGSNGNVTAKTSFGSPVYAVTTTTSAGGLGGGFGMQGGGNRGSNFQGSQTSTAMAPIRGRAAPYGVATSFEAGQGFQSSPMSIRAHNEASAVLARSTSFVNNQRLQVVMDGEVAVLRGEVADPRERRLAEALLRTTPGIHEVRNELQIKEPEPVKP